MQLDIVSHDHGPSTSTLQSFQDCRLEQLRSQLAREPTYHSPITIDNKLLEIPLHASATHEPRYLTLHPLIQWRCLLAVDICLPQDRETDTIIGRSRGLGFLFCL